MREKMCKNIINVRMLIPVVAFESFQFFLSVKGALKREECITQPDLHPQSIKPLNSRC